MTTSSPSFAKSLVFFTCHNLHVFLIQATTNRVVLIVVLTSLNLTPNIPTLTVGTCASQGLRLHFWCAARPKGVPDARGRSRVRGVNCEAETFVIACASCRDARTIKT
ncbi:hypothetical protein PsYK624_044650 [Phanerochaete sordida]|uniref:Uncharacterized protein n=1 Tax=Phanerochaete sordida TaxID=48140 RepID=A0A9P3G5C0_9APHY|nr:hypothetical protein PsYK624_044650 [Phanerochaete sordida]